VDDHPRVLQEGVQTVSVGRNGAWERSKGVGHEVQEQEEKGGIEHQDEGGPWKKIRHAFPVPVERHCSKGDQEPGPQEKGSLLSRPEGGDSISVRQRLVGVFENVKE